MNLDGCMLYQCRATVMETVIINGHGLTKHLQSIWSFKIQAMLRRLFVKKTSVLLLNIIIAGRSSLLRGAP